jgi:predicted nuclease of restriction endonuclease-like RecB superfamily
LCHATPGETKEEIMVEISGPFSLFRHTRIYGRALSSLIPRLCWCNSYRLEADCVLGTAGTSIGRLVLGSGDPVAPARELAPFDSKVEERFAREFGKLAREWDVVREPQAIEAGGGLIFPDFELRHRMTGKRWLLEIVGYWTADYVQRKLSLVRAARIDRLILCIDEERHCDDDLLEIDARVVRYRRKVDPRAVLEIVDPGALKDAQPSPQKRKARIDFEVKQVG